MPYKTDFRDGAVHEWELTDDGARCTTVEEYTPSLYATAEDGDLAGLESFLDPQPAVAGTARERWRTGFRNAPTEVLRVDVATVEQVRRVAHRIRDRGEPGAHRCYNVDFSPQFRYCLERDRSPVPGRDLELTTLDVPDPELADCPVTELTLDGETVAGSPAAVVGMVDARVRDRDPDVLVLSSGSVVPALYETAEAAGVDLQLGRRPGWQRLAADSTFHSYGRVGHSPARYDVPGRAIIDRSNTFLYSQTNLHGCLDLVERSGKPLQELAWASIGNVLTSIQVREALARGVLVPWKSWRPECFKSMRQLHDADRGGFTFSPDVGFHEDVHELDFSSLYPNIICTHNVSPDTIRCDCHADREDVPGLGYSICDERGYLVDVLQPLIDARDDCKATLAATDDADCREALQGQADAIKWILVSCFGYQGFSNAKFGRIECHEAINAFAREILLDAKETLERNGWRIVHGIVDSLWVTPADDESQRALDTLAAELSDEVGIELEYEAAYDWLAFVPQRNTDAGALTKYFGSKSEGGYKYRGIECRQRSTPPFISRVQRELIETLDATRDPAAVCDCLRDYLGTLRAGDVPAADLLVDKRASKAADEYHHYTRTVAALERAADAGFDRSPGQSVAYVVVDDEKRSRARVELEHELSGAYDANYYGDLLVRATESVLSPLGWDEARIRSYLAETDQRTVHAY